MQQIEFNTNILENGYISLPPEIRKKWLLKPNQPIRVTIEIHQSPEIPAKSYSFKKVRNLLKGIKGEMSAEIIAERKDRI